LTDRLAEAQHYALATEEAGRVEWQTKTGSGPVVIDLRVMVNRKRGRPGDWVEVTVTTPTRDGQLVLFQGDAPLDR
jgi:hypothetical protein